MATYSGSDKRLQYLFQHGGGGSLEDLDDVEITNPSDGDALVYDGEEEKWVNGEGGGGNANEQVLTKAEYDALTEEQKMNNTTYYINDADTWTSKEVQPVIYSTDEREIGVWTDGKPLYEKTINIGTLTYGTSWVSVAHNILNLDSVIQIRGRALGSQDNRRYEFPTYRTGGTTGISLGCDNTYIYYINNWLASVSNASVTIRYTKTTDQAGSGIYTPQGQLAVHYSTDEHVIGTWVDGSTLYEKTLIKQGGFSNVTDWTLFDDSVSYDKLIFTKGVRIETSLNSVPFSNTLDDKPRFTVKTDHKLYYFSDNRSADSWYITIQYTKTTS